MPTVTTIFKPAATPTTTTGSALTSPSSQPPVAIVTQLQSELGAIGLPITGAEAGANPQFGAATSAQLKVFQDRYKLDTTGNLDPTTGGILTLSALVAGETDRTKLQQGLQNLSNAVPNSPQYNDWLARYAIMSGDYSLAAKASPRLTDLSGLNITLGSGIATTGGSGSPKAPEVPFPENFYSYHNSLMLQEDIDQLRTLSGSQFPNGSTPFLARMSSGTGTPGAVPPQMPPPGVVDPPPAAAGSGMTQGQALAASALAWLNAIEAWQQGNNLFAEQEYGGAVAAYDRCQQAALDYFSIFPDYKVPFTTSTLPTRMDELVWRLASDKQTWSTLWLQIAWRRQLLSLAEIGGFDWTPINSNSTAYLLFKGNLQGNDQPAWLNTGNSPLDPRFRQSVLDTPLFVIATGLVPLARGEANRLRRQYADAITDFTRVLRRNIPIPNNTTLNLTVFLPCEFIEIPFGRLLLIESMMDQAEAQYKSRSSVDDETDDATRTQELSQITQIAQQLTAANIPGDTTPGALPLQHLTAAISYSNAMQAVQDDGQYLARTQQALATLQANVKTTVSSGDVTSLAFRSLAQTVTIPTISGIGNSLPGLTSGTHPHEPYLKFTSPDGQAMREVNPRVYALLMQAQSRLVQIWSGFNYLGYRDDYVPPWRFQYLLDRARYFSDHARNAERDYLNFLNNAENEEFKEMSAGQNVELEQANVQIESAEVDQAADQVAASQQSAVLANLNATDAQTRTEHYVSFDQYANQILGTTGPSGFGQLMVGANTIPLVGSELGTAVTGAFDFVSGGFLSRAQQDAVSSAQRALELDNLRLAAGEAAQAANVAQAQLQVAKAGLVVAGLQRQAALLRHEFAVQNLQYLVNQTLNTEQWYRLAGSIRSVSDTYLRYAIQISFLAQQAYNFESDKRLSVIRFDYDLSDVGAMLAADFLERDLDSLEQDLIVSQQTRQQEVRYVLSMAREFPDTLRTLADTGVTIFSMQLGQLEKHFPGLFNLRISSIDVQPVALMDPTRLSVELTHLGTGMIRLKAQPGTSPLNTTDLPANADWLPNAQTDWPIKIQVSGPETACYTGLSRQDASSLSTIDANERVAFEGLGAASAWQINMSMNENQVVPGTFADMLITFTMSAFFDSSLRDAVSQAPPTSFAVTKSISARQTLPDAFYSLAQTGSLDWDLDDDMLVLSGTPGALRNVAVMLPLIPDGLELSRCYCRYPIQIQVAAGAVTVLTLLPQITLTQTALTLNCNFTGTADAQVSWDFGDNTVLVQGLTAQHIYLRPGRYTLLTRLSKNGTLFEYRSAIVVSTNNSVVTPLVVSPVFSAAAAAAVDGTVAVTVALPSGISDVSLDCSAGTAQSFADSGPIVLNLKPGTYLLDFLAMRKLSARFFCKQRYFPTIPVTLYRGRISTNRTFDLTTGVNTTASPNALATQLFGDGTVTISPDDRWTLELPLTENPCFMTVSPSDIAAFDGSELVDAIITLEYLLLSRS